MTQYPLIIRSQGDATSGIQTSWKTAVPSFDELNVSIPREFDGPNSAYSPEDLFAMALVNCFIATFKVVAEKSRVTFEHLSGTCDLTIDYNKKENGLVSATSASFKFHLSGASDRDRAERLMNQVSKQCLLINSIKADKTFEFSIDASTVM